jgi:hypothetical protein
VYPDDPTVVTTISISAPQTNSGLFWRKGVASLLTILQVCNREIIPGQFILHSSTAKSLEASLTLYFVNTTDISTVESRVKTHMTTFIGESGMSHTLSLKFQAKISSELRMVADIYPENYGILSGSMLISNQFFNSPEGPLQMAESFARVPMGPNDILFTSNLGGRVIANKDLVDTAMHPAWRSSAQLITFVRAVETSIDGKVSALEELTTVQMPVLYSLEDPSFRVSYSNLGDPNEKHFQRVYWGDRNYKRLLRIKQKVDKDGLFVTRLGVGSEGWDEEGMCRKERNMISQFLEVL